jgi:hypothetical protein
MRVSPTRVSPTRVSPTRTCPTCVCPTRISPTCVRPTHIMVWLPTSRCTFHAHIWPTHIRLAHLICICPGALLACTVARTQFNEALQTLYDWEHVYGTTGFAQFLMATMTQLNECGLLPFWMKPVEGSDSEMRQEEPQTRRGLESEITRCKTAAAIVKTEEAEKLSLKEAAHTAEEEAFAALKVCTLCCPRQIASLDTVFCASASSQVAQSASFKANMEHAAAVVERDEMAFRLAALEAALLDLEPAKKKARMDDNASSRRPGYDTEYKAPEFQGFVKEGCGRGEAAKSSHACAWRVFGSANTHSPDAHSPDAHSPDAMRVRPTRIRPTCVRPTQMRVRPTRIRPTRISLTQMRVRPTRIRPTQMRVRPTRVRPTRICPTCVRPTHIRPTHVRPTHICAVCPTRVFARRSQPICGRFRCAGCLF